MSPVTKQWLHLLETRFGVGPEFASHLLPVLERFAEQEPSAAEREKILRGVAAAYRSCQVVQTDSVDEVKLLLTQFVTELKKLDETLKVLGVYLERVRQRISRPSPRRMLH